MSISDNSTVAVPHEGEGAYDPLNESDYYSQPRDTVLDKSPYAECEIVLLDAGTSATRFLVHSSMIRKSAPLFALASKGQPVTLSKLDESAAHTLVNYLYTGNFQTLLSHEFSDDDAAYEGFKLPTCVYCAAVRYQLPGLAELSRQKITYAGQRLPIFDILKIARDHAFPLLPEADRWYSEYLENTVHDAMSQDPEPFRRPDFITKVEGNSRLLQIVWKTVMSNCAAVIAQVSGELQLENGAETPMADSPFVESEVATQQSFHQLPSPTESVLDSPLPESAQILLKEPEHLDIVLSASESVRNSTVASSSEADDSNAQIDTASNDNFDLPAIEPTIDHHENMDTVKAKREGVKKYGHVRADSVLGEEAVLDKDSDDAKRGGPVEAIPAAGNGNHDTPKKEKKKSKKKRSSIAF
ncbi:uncharacterized protein EKO05_0000644 [Ascochyta rabiei]|uniref:Uncharacterized protein n=1 Tax=Didymella rabiei TaxID=5454 RepID=A0A163HLM6_DIDRA|nr:uncharacterized protein EKO05_0000644 [Ascochyta rabiei]KZM25353.1 hypothetical protein ST47_g3565 [Ascochyta rabiei]UPX09968.1 hypothetical protein EKO05_0000644 [Ascochyta rabiei]